MNVNYNVDLESFKKSLLVINGNDYTDRIVLQSFTVNNLDVYEEYEDADYVKHHRILRTKISGNLTLKFMNAFEYNQFLVDLNAKKSKDEGYYTIDVYTVNTMELHTDVKAYVAFTPADEIGVRFSEASGYQITIEER